MKKITDGVDDKWQLLQMMKFKWQMTKINNKNKLQNELQKLMTKMNNKNEWQKWMMKMNDENE